MNIVYSLVACGNTILAEFSSSESNTHLFAKQILAQLESLPDNMEGKKSYPFQGYAIDMNLMGGSKFSCVAYFPLKGFLFIRFCRGESFICVSRTNLLVSGFPLDF
eukprot:TRINITY_DN3276_c0_g5_i4.p1 TRINITY_DN3276_c0_g5~~TRINITY_DN3276_c0_g5_i4.p1  ORF type:complete len:106 (+),score=1.66 TRINITY_DN3276_c0_g5_i4:492-809(+)